MVACVVGAVSHLSHSLTAVSVGFFWSPPPPHTQPLVRLLLLLWLLWLASMMHNLLETSEIHKL